MDTPRLELTPDGTPRSARYDDVYFSRDDGLAESRYVFLDHNRLTERFRAMRPHEVFTIVETGFGTGLNCLATWQRFRDCAPDSARLVFVSTERYPLSREEITASLGHWPELSPLLARLIETYPHRFEGYHCVELDDRVDLLLLFGDANDTLPDLNARVDAWFLDGFAPSKNPELWQPPLFGGYLYGGPRGAGRPGRRRLRSRTGERPWPQTRHGGGALHRTLRAAPTGLVAAE